MRDAERKLFDDVLAELGNKANVLGVKPLTAFCAVKGVSADGALFVVGRAVNGWDNEFAPAELTVPEGRERILTTIYASSEKTNPCPMSWVATDWKTNDKCKYNPAKSAFWRVIRRIVEGLQIADVNGSAWPSYLMYSNLYKVAPKCGYNPTGLLLNLQEAKCGELLREELRQWKPSRLLFLVGQYWFSRFQDTLQITGSSIPNNHYVEFVGQLKAQYEAATTRVVVAKHPQGKSETPLVEEVVSAFSPGP